MVVSSVSSPGVVNHLKRFLDDIVFISKTQDMCRKQSEVVSALQSHFETQSHFKRLKKKNYPHANQRQLSLYTEGVAHLRKWNVMIVLKIIHLNSFVFSDIFQF
jgi:hypothetical protein